MEQLKKDFFPKYEKEALLYLLQLVENGPKQYQDHVILIVECLIPFTKLGSPKVCFFFFFFF